jgi:hypothetical protein
MRSLIIAAAVLGCLLPCGFVFGAEPVEIGGRLEPLVDEFLIERLSGDAKLTVHRPEPREVVLTADEPWEGNTSAYFTVLRDGGRFRMYYRGSHFDVDTQKGTHPEFTCYAESEDGIRWTKPKLGLFEFNGSRANNIVWSGPGTHNFTPFRDANPNCPADARYKALARGNPKGLYAFQSADGIHWKPMTERAVITDGAFDSQNLAFWDPHVRAYREYHRGFREGRRDIMTGTSSDFLNWTAPKYLDYTHAEPEHLYTNAVMPYPGAPHLLIGFPTRYQPKNSQVEPILMTSRDGATFRRWGEPLIPITAPEERDGNRSNYMAWGLVELPGDERHFSVYATERYYAGPGSRLRRFTFRKDGIVSVHAGEKGGELVTRPLRFDGDALRLNVRTAPGGEVRAELQDAAGKPIDGFTLADCTPLRGDSLDAPVTWKGGDLNGLADRPVRLRLTLTSADVYTLRFR